MLLCASAPLSQGKGVAPPHRIKGNHNGVMPHCAIKNHSPTPRKENRTLWLKQLLGWGGGQREGRDKGVKE